jgi:hypothetical protein
MRKWIIQVIGLVLLSSVAPVARSQSKGEGSNPGNANPGNSNPGNSNPGADPAAGKGGPIPRTGSDANQPSSDDPDSSTKKKKKKTSSPSTPSGRASPEHLRRPNRDWPYGYGS